MRWPKSVRQRTTDRTLSGFVHMALDPSSARILVVDDEEDILVAARLLLKRHFATVQTVSDPSRLPDLGRQGAFDVLLLDMNFTIGVDDGAEGLRWLSE